MWFICGAICFVALLLVVLPKLVRLSLSFQKAKPNKLRIAFAHPDLGIGGAERLVVDAAVALQQKGHEVFLFTARHEPHHCYEQTRDGTLKVVVYGDFLPRRILGRLYAACAYLRMCWVSLRVVLLSLGSAFDVIIVDQVSICIPILLVARARGIIFYCHYPDYLLTTRTSLLKRIYRAPLDFLEEQTTGLADMIFVNSNFTAGVFADSFPSLDRRGIKPSILYPALDLSYADASMAKAEDSLQVLGKGEQLLISLNRFERKKNIGLAVTAFALLPESVRKTSKLILAGGYDERLPENVEHAKELSELAQKLGVSDRVTQMWSISEVQKATLLRHASCMLYTPDKEHFGIVPVESMYARTPVITINSGGPLESVVNGETGFHCPQDAKNWAEAIGRLLGDTKLQERMGKAGRKRAEDKFSLAAFGKILDDSVKGLAVGKDEMHRD